MRRTSWRPLIAISDAPLADAWRGYLALLESAKGTLILDPDELAAIAAAA